MPFYHINRFYDYISLHNFIKKGIEKDISSLQKELLNLRKKIKRYETLLEQAPTSEVWISDYEINNLKSKINKHNERLNSVKAKDILNTNSYLLLT